MNETLEQMEERHAAERAELMRREIEQAYLRGMEGRPRNGRITLRLINEAVAEEHGFAAADLLEPTRVCAEVCEARFEAWTRAQKAGFALSAIGRYYGRDHSTVWNGVKRHKELNKQKNKVTVQ